MINVAFMIDTITSPTGGTEKQLLFLLEHLDRSRFKPVLCVLRSSKWLETEFNLCPVYHVAIHSFKNPRTVASILRLSRFFRKEAIDIVQVFFKDSTKVGVLAAKMAGVGAVIISKRNQGYWLGRGERFLFKVLDHWADLIVANSESTRKWVRDIEGVSEKRIRVVHNGIDVSAFDVGSSEVRQASRRSLGISDGAAAIGIVANLRAIKGHDVFLRAAQRVKQRVPAACFIVVGHGELEHELKNLATELGILDSVKFLGKVHDVASVLVGLDVGVLSSWSESSSNAVAEYLAAGLPIVCTDVGGVDDMVEEGANGYVVPLGDDHAMADRVVEVLTSRDRMHMGLVSRERAVRLFQLREMLDRYEEIYASECSRTALLSNERGGLPQ